MTKRTVISITTVVGIPMSASSKRKLDQCLHSDDFTVDWVDENGHNVIQSSSSRRRLQQHPSEDVPLELVDDSEWNAIESAFHALPESQRQISSRIIKTSTSTAPQTSSMVPSILPSSPPLPTPHAATAGHHRFYPDALCQGHSPERLKHIPSASLQLSTAESLKQKEFSCWRSRNSGNGQGASPWKMGTGPLPGKLPTGHHCLGGGGLTQIQCADLQSSDRVSPGEGADTDSRTLESQERNVLTPEVVVGSGKSSKPAVSQLSGAVPPNAEEGIRGSSKKQSTRSLPAWIEPAGRYLLSLEKSRSVEQSRDGSGLQVLTNSGTVDDEQISRPNAEQLGDAASAPGRTGNDHPVWVQFDQTQLGLPWGFQPPSLVVEVKPKFPSMEFRGQIVYSTTESEVNAATDELWRRVLELQNTRKGVVPIGFDLEWRANFEKGERPNKVAVLQLCLDGSRCDVMQIIYSGIPPSLQDFLEAPSTLKVGVGIYGDAAKLQRDYQLTTRKIADLSILANNRMKNMKQWSLSSLALELTGKQVDKNRSIRCGDWEALPLSEPQLRYAATDAFASLHLYQVLASFPNPETNQGGSDDSEFDSKPPTT